MYGPVKDSEKTELESFVIEERNAHGPTFDVDFHLLVYCRRDTLCLMQSVLKFDELLTSETGLHPFSSCMTVSQYVGRVWRWQYYPDSVGELSAPNERG